MDLAIGVLVFLLAIGIIYSLLNSQARQDVTPLRLDSEVVATKLTNDPSVKVADENKLDMDALFALAKNADVNYTKLKEELGIENEFCIYLVDENGNLTYITNGSEKFTGVGSGSGELNVSGNECGAMVP